MKQMGTGAALIEYQAVRIVHPAADGHVDPLAVNVVAVVSETRPGAASACPAALPGRVA
jgi:hypothetical protein